MNRVWLPCVVLACAALAACDKAPKNDAAPDAASAAAISDEDIPVAEDYIEETTKEVTSANYAAELDKIEKEINAAK